MVVRCQFCEFSLAQQRFFHLIFIELLLDVIQSVHATRMTCCDVVRSSLHDDTTPVGDNLTSTIINSHI